MIELPVSQQYYTMNYIYYYNLSFSLVVNDFNEVFEILQPIASSYAELGLHLQITYSEIEVIRLDYQSTRKCLMEIIRRWIRGNGLKATWSNLVNTLHQMGEYFIAEQIINVHYV